MFFDTRIRSDDKGQKAPYRTPKTIISGLFCRKLGAKVLPGVQKQHATPCSNAIIIPYTRQKVKHKRLVSCPIRDNNPPVFSPTRPLFPDLHPGTANRVQNAKNWIFSFLQEKVTKIYVIRLFFAIILRFLRYFQQLQSVIC